MAPKSHKPAADPRNRVLTVNRKARHDYDVIDTFECGIQLAGSEVKSLREGKAQLKDSYGRVQSGEVWLLGVHVPPYDRADSFHKLDPERPRKLLLHRREIDQLMGRVQQDSLTLIPMSIYLKDGRVKVELALAKGRRQYDKRHALAEREANREAERAMARGRRGE